MSRPSITAVSAEMAEELLKDAANLRRLSVEGRLLLKEEGRERSWGQYCEEAQALAEQGEFRRALQSASKALYVGERDGNAVAVAFAKRDFATVYLYAGKLDLAERYAQEATAEASLAREPNKILQMTYKILGDVLLRNGQPEKAAEWYEKARKASTVFSSWRTLMQVSKANALLEARQGEKALAVLDDAGSGSSPVAELALRTRARALAALGRREEASKAFARLLAESKAEDAAYFRIWGHEGRGRVLMAAGDAEGAAAAFDAAIVEAEKVRARFRSEEIKAGSFAEMQDLFDAAVAVHVRRGASARAFEVAEAGRARALLDQVQSRPKLVAGAKTIAEASGKPVAADALQSRLSPGQTMVVYHSLADETLVWVIRRGELRLQRLAIGRGALEAKVRVFRRSAVDRLELRALAQELHAALVKPLALAAEERLLIVPHGALHGLPFQALHDGERWLIERHAVSYLPSASTGVQLAERAPVEGAQSLLALGNPDLNNPRMNLPGAEAEVRQIAQTVTAAEVHVRAAASRNRFLANAGKHELIHVAAHAEVDWVDPLYSRLRMAPDASGGGDVAAYEIYGLDLSKASLVTLSACDTGATTVARGDEVFGFSRSLLTAGSRSLLLSLWPAADAPTAGLMRRFYELRTQVGSAEALRRAQIEFIRETGDAADAQRGAKLSGAPAQPVERSGAVSHPFYWATFMLIGTGG